MLSFSLLYLLVICIKIAENTKTRKTDKERKKKKKGEEVLATQ